MSATYKVTYFNYRGLAEAMRWLLLYMGEDFEDVRLTHEEWPSIKPSMYKLKQDNVNVFIKHQQFVLFLPRY